MPVNIAESLVPEPIEQTAGSCLKLVHELVGEASSIVKAAHACADAGNADGAYQIVLDIELLLFDATNLMQALSVIRRRGSSPP